MRKSFAILSALLILAACNLPRSNLGSNPGGAGVPQDVATTNPQACISNWDTRPLPAISARLQSAIRAAGLTGVRASAEAYGEDCTYPQGNAPTSFTSMETDFHITARVADLSDTAALGNLLEKVLVILDAFPAGSTPGPQPGSIRVSFQGGSDELNLTFTTTAEQSARALGLHGAALIEKLQNK